MIARHLIAPLGRLALAVALAAPVASPAFADPAPAVSPMQEAGKHFEHGVALYDEADYRAALVEFRRAYEIAPNAVVLYNIGETYYQLQNYAAALTALTRYLAESGDAAEHRAEVQKTIAILRTRVGTVEITTNVPGCEITVDDELIGKTPLAAAIPISIGRRKITAMRAGLTPDTRFVEVAAGDTAKAALTLVDPNGHAGDANGNTPGVIGQDTADHDGRHKLIEAGWITTGVLGVAALTAGTVAIVEAHKLTDDRNTFGISHSTLTQKASRVTTFSAIADITGIVAIAAGALSLELTLTRSSSHEVHATVSPTGVAIGGSFH